LNRKKIEEYYLLALVEITNGASIQGLEEDIELYEEEERYEECAGILKAIHESGYLTIKDIIKTLDNE